MNGFKKAGICEAFEQARQLKDLAENPFLEIDIESDMQIVALMIDDR